MKSKLLIFIVISSLSLFFVTKVNAVNSPPVLILPTDPESPPPVVNPKAPPPAPVPQTPIPAPQPRPLIDIPLNTTPTSKPNPGIAPPGQTNNVNPNAGLSNYNLFGNINSTNYSTLFILFVLWFSLTGLLAILAFIVGLYKRKNVMSENKKVVNSENKVDFKKLPPY